MKKNKNRYEKRFPVEETQRNINQIRLLGLVDTTKYLVAGGRVNRAIAAVADIFRIKPLLTFKDGEAVRRGLARTYLRGIDDLCEFVEINPNVQDLAIAYSNVTCPHKGYHLLSQSYRNSSFRSRWPSSLISF